MEQHNLPIKVTEYLKITAITPHDSAPDMMHAIKISCIFFDKHCDVFVKRKFIYNDIPSVKIAGADENYLLDELAYMLMNTHWDVVKQLWHTTEDKYNKEK